MLKLAHDRIAQSPEKYVDHVYGEHEHGGTSTFYISPVPFEELGFPISQETESPASFNRLVTHGTPVVAAAVAIGMTGAYLAIERQSKDNAAARAEHAEEAGEEHHG
jgi:formate dehydrogenase iron-sulfur subunit